MHKSLPRRRSVTRIAASQSASASRTTNPLPPPQPLFATTRPHQSVTTHPLPDFQAFQRSHCPIISFPPSALATRRTSAARATWLPPPSLASSPPPPPPPPQPRPRGSPRLPPPPERHPPSCGSRITRRAGLGAPSLRRRGRRAGGRPASPTPPPPPRRASTTTPSR
jgi:formin 2